MCPAGHRSSPHSLTENSLSAETSLSGEWSAEMELFAKLIQTGDHHPDMITPNLTVNRTLSELCSTYISLSGPGLLNSVVTGAFKNNPES